MKKKNYASIWLVFLNIKPQKGRIFKDLIDDVDSKISDEKILGAWTKILIKADTIGEALNIVSPGLNEIGFDVEFIDKIENFEAPFENNEISEEIVEEANWLLESNYVFKMTSEMFTYE